MKKILSAFVALILGTGLAGLGVISSASADTIGVVGTIVPFTPESNSASWWNDEGEHPAECYKHELGANDHGSTTDGNLTVTLNEFNQSWPGDHWELLAIKAGNDVNVIQHPTAGVAYASPNNPAGNQATVSHWIVCKGTTPEVEPDVAKADYGLTPATCTTGQSVTIGNDNLTNATWTAESLAKNGTVGPAEFDITAVLNPNAVWAEGNGSFHVILGGPDTSLCDGLVECPAFTDGGTATNLSANGWTIPAEAEFVNDGIKLNVAGDWDETYIERPFTGLLKDLGTGVDFTANPVPFVGIHVVTSAGVLVYEKEASYDGKWWSNSSTFNAPDGLGYPTFDTLENIVKNNSTVTISAIRVLYTSPTESSTVITSVKFGCEEYTFDYIGAPEPFQYAVPEEQVDCTTELVDITTRTFDVTWVQGDGKWDRLESLISTIVTHRAATVEELDTAECPLPEEPEPFNETITQRDVDCAADTITVTSQTKFHTWELVEREWVEVVETGAPVVVVLDADDTSCPPVVTTEKLAFTGSAPNTAAALAGVGLLLAAGGVLLAIRKRSKRVAE